jgi:RNA polymerase sigma factor (sigma-70 family)
MAEAPIRFLLRHLSRGPAAAPKPAPDDAELLERFVCGRDETAFELLVGRYGAMVYDVCRRVLRDDHAAEDAFQAAFLVLARKAATVSRRDALPGWLHRVARRVALRARARVAPRVGREFPEPAVEDPDTVLWRDLRTVLDEEIDRLPEKYRLPVVLCYLTGLTTDEAARRIGVPRGTVLSRLAWARERLRGRLSLRGVTLAAALPVALLAPTARAAPAPLAQAAIRAALECAAGQPAAAPAVASLTEGVLRDMVLNKIKNGFLVVLALAALGLGVALWATRPAAAEPGDRKRDDTHRPAVPADAPVGKEEGRGPEAPRPVGIWERTVAAKEGNLTLTLRIDAHRVTLTLTAAQQGKTAKVFTLDGDYSVSRDYVLYGFVTGIDVSEGVDDPDKVGKEAARFLDQPFAIRYRVEEGALTIRDIKAGGLHDDAGREELQMLAGRYKKKGAGKEDK